VHYELVEDVHTVQLKLIEADCYYWRLVVST